MLTVQYRMHPEIRSFPSHLFYDGKLQDAPHLTLPSPDDPEAGEKRKKMMELTPHHAVPYFAPYLVFNVLGRGT